MPRKKVKGKWIRTRYCVEAHFADQTRVVLRDYETIPPAQKFAASLNGRDLYPGRVYTIQIHERELIPDDDFHINPARRPGD